MFHEAIHYQGPVMALEELPKVDLTENLDFLLAYLNFDIA